jgi:signal transduction histidine kinase
LRFLDKEPSDRDEVRAALHRIVNDGHRTSDVFDGIRSLFRKVDQGRDPVDINKLILGVLQSLQGDFKDRNIELRSELAADLPLIDGHASQLQEVIFNLVRNATEAMDNVTDRNRVLQVTTALRDRETIAVAVEDSGPGIDPKRLDEIFNAFFTTKSQGTGLGLAICRMIIEHHGGQLIASSDGKNGALFQFVLPIDSAEIVTITAR